MCAIYFFFFFLMIRRPPRSTLDRSSAASDVYKRQTLLNVKGKTQPAEADEESIRGGFWCDNGVCNLAHTSDDAAEAERELAALQLEQWLDAVSYTHLRAHETVLDLVCRLLLEKKKNCTHYNTDGTVTYMQK